MVRGVSDAVLVFTNKSEEKLIKIVIYDRNIQQTPSDRPAQARVHQAFKGRKDKDGALLLTRYPGVFFNKSAVADLVSEAPRFRIRA